MKSFVGIILLFFSVGCFALPDCPPDQKPENYHNCYGTHEWRSGPNKWIEKYVGGYKDGKRHGHGTHTFSDLRKYSGEWKNDKRHGYGTYIDDSMRFLDEISLPQARKGYEGEKYVGYWKNNKRHGKGEEIKDGQKYIGEFKDDKKNGKGTLDFVLHDKNGVLKVEAEYIGEFKDDKFHGQGKYNRFYLEDNVREKIFGYFEVGNLKKGTATNSNGAKYIGEFESGFGFSWWHGQGTHILLTGDKYVGEFKDGAYYGKGTFTFANGDTYAGSFIDYPKEFDKFKQWVRSNLTLQTYASTNQVQKQKVVPEKSTLDLKVIVSNPKENGEVTLTINTNADTASLKVNGKEEGGKSTGKYSVKRFARAGLETSFEIVAMDTSGNTQSATVSVTRTIAQVTSNDYETLKPQSLKKRKKRDAVAIIIGIENYINVPKAQFANNDASAFYDYAINALGVPKNKVQLLIDKQADDIDIVRVLENWLPLNTNKEKTDIYLFYSGHGLPSPDGNTLYVLPYGVDKDFLDRTAISQESIISALKDVSPKSATLFLDSCYSGSTRDGKTLMASARPIVITQIKKKYPDNFTVLSASSPEQISFSNPNLEHGIFSFYLMKGLEGKADINKDGKIKVKELDDYLKTSVARNALSMNKRQTPQVVGNPEKVIVR